MFTRRRMLVAGVAATAGALSWISRQRGGLLVNTPVRTEFVIEPHRGIGPVSLGMTRTEVAAAMAAVGGGTPDPRNAETDCYFGASFQVSFGDAGRADFIEVCSSMPVPVLFAGRDVRDTPADDLLALVGQIEPLDRELSGSDSYHFSTQILALWGPEMQYDYLGGRKRVVFATVGIGGPSYLAAIRAIRRK